MNERLLAGLTYVFTRTAIIHSTAASILTMRKYGKRKQSCEERAPSKKRYVSFKTAVTNGCNYSQISHKCFHCCQFCRAVFLLCLKETSCSFGRLSLLNFRYLQNMVTLDKFFRNQLL